MACWAASVAPARARQARPLALCTATSCPSPSAQATSSRRHFGCERAALPTTASRASSDRAALATPRHRRRHRRRGVASSSGCRQRPRRAGTRRCNRRCLMREHLEVPAVAARARHSRPAVNPCTATRFRWGGARAMWSEKTTGCARAPSRPMGRGAALARAASHHRRCHRCHRCRLRRHLRLHGAESHGRFFLAPVVGRGHASMPRSERRSKRRARREASAGHARARLHRHLHPRRRESSGESTLCSDATSSCPTRARASSRRPGLESCTRAV